MILKSISLLFLVCISCQASDLSFIEFKKEHEQMVEVLIQADQKTSFDTLYPIEGRTTFSLRNILNFNAYASSDLCFFGGWPSQRQEGLCKAPWKFSMRERFGVSYDSEHYCGHPDMFRCNPILFGPGVGSNHFEKNGRGLEAGICVNFKSNGHSIRDVTKLCSESSSQKNMDLLYKRYLSDQDYRRQYHNLREEVLLHCEGDNASLTCRQLKARFEKTDKEVACLGESFRYALPVSPAILSTFNSLTGEKQSSLGPKLSVRPRPKPRRNLSSDEQERDISKSCEELFHGKDVLYIGDSHSYLASKKGSRMGNHIAKRVNECGAESFHYRGVCGSRPSHWMPGKTPKSTCGVSSMGPDRFHTATKGQTENLEQLSNKTGAEVVMINLGDNMFNWKGSGVRKAYIASEKSVINEVKKLLSALKGTQECVWIGPAYHVPGKFYNKSNHAVDQMYRAIEKAVGKRCRIIDSRPYFSSSSPNDGLHFLPSESGHWGEQIAQDL